MCALLLLVWVEQQDEQEERQRCYGLFDDMISQGQHKGMRYQREYNSVSTCGVQASFMSAVSFLPFQPSSYRAGAGLVGGTRAP
jgi:hypothetical protein